VLTCTEPNCPTITICGTIVLAQGGKASATLLGCDLLASCVFAVVLSAPAEKRQRLVPLLNSDVL
jgi:hypothetical protein